MWNSEVNKRDKLRLITNWIWDNHPKTTNPNHKTCKGDAQLFSHLEPKYLALSVWPVRKGIYIEHRKVGSLSPILSRFSSIIQCHIGLCSAWFANMASVSFSRRQILYWTTRPNIPATVCAKVNTALHDIELAISMQKELSWASQLQSKKTCSLLHGSESKVVSEDKPWFINSSQHTTNLFQHLTTRIQQKRDSENQLLPPVSTWDGSRGEMSGHSEMWGWGAVRISSPLRTSAQGHLGLPVFYTNGMEQTP